MSNGKKLKKGVEGNMLKSVQEQFAKMAEYVNNLGRAIQMMGMSIRRLEVLQGLSEPPEEWNITESRMILIAETEGVSMDQAREKLIMSFGQYKLEEEEDET